ILAGLGAVVWRFTKPEAVFVVRVSGGNAKSTHGTVTAAFLAAVEDVCREFGIASCELRGVARGRRIALRFSGQFPPAARQRLRNWWAQSGWSAPQRPRPRPRR